MKLRKFITRFNQKAESGKQICFAPDICNFRRNFIFYGLFLLLTAYCLPIFATTQKIAILVPEKTESSQKFADKLKNSLSSKFKILDESLSETAFRANVFENAFNLSTAEAKAIGAAIGCEYFLLIKSANVRRSTFEKEELYESFASIYTISSRTGRLVFWKLQKFEAEKSFEAERLLFNSTENLAAEIIDKLKLVSKEELNEKSLRKIEEIPDENAPEAKNFRPPLPYKRFKPEYTRLAYIYDVTATVDILVELDENGSILHTEIVRWAGYGLDESVTETVNRMNWRPAERDGKSLPMRVLLRYNFKKIEKED